MEYEKDPITGKKTRHESFETAASGAGGSFFLVYGIAGIAVFLLVMFFKVAIYAGVFWLISIPVFKSFKKRNMSDEKYKKAKIIRWACVAALLIFGACKWYYSDPVNQNFTPIVTIAEIQKEFPLSQTKDGIYHREGIKKLVPGEKLTILKTKGNGTVKVKTADGTVGFVRPDAFSSTMNIIPPKDVPLLVRAIGWQFKPLPVTLLQQGTYTSENSNIEIDVGKNELKKSGKVRRGSVRNYRDLENSNSKLYLVFSAAKNKAPVEITGIGYNYTIKFWKIVGGSDTANIPITEGDLAGEFIVTSNNSFVSRDGKVEWKLTNKR